VCAHLPVLRPRTRVVILQHPREHRMPLGTARMAARCLAGSTLVVGTRLDDDPAVRAALDDPARRAVLLWPEPAAAPAPPAVADAVTLVVVDGTWAQAKKLLALNPRIAALPRLSIAPEAPSQYRIRRQPREECLSTIEALATALGVLEGDAEAPRAMLVPFRAMVDAQIARAGGRSSPRALSPERRARRPSWRPPAALRDPSRVLVVAVETNAWPFDAKDRHPDEIVHWLSVRGDGVGLRETVVRPTHPLAPGVTAHTGLAAEALLAGVPREELARTCRTLLAEHGVVATWGSYATRMMSDEGLAPARAVVDLRRVAADWAQESPGSIERFVGALDPAPPVLGAGRGGRRLGLMLRALRAVCGPRPERPSAVSRTPTSSGAR
jgi:DTW domain-containing protein YfiP